MVTKYDHGHIIFQAVYIQTISMPSGVFKPYAFTFQSGYIQIRCVPQCHFQFHICLYIPIWLYSNETDATKGVRSMDFTFQSGYIQINLALFYVNLILDFTFQSGYIQIPTPPTVPHFPPYFTFQSGYIQIKKPETDILLLITLHSNLVIFKYWNVKFAGS